MRNDTQKSPRGEGFRTREKKKWANGKKHSIRDPAMAQERVVYSTFAGKSGIAVL